MKKTVKHDVDTVELLGLAQEIVLRLVERRKETENRVSMSQSKNYRNELLHHQIKNHHMKQLLLPKL
jgi:hypothetical protein